MAYDYSRRFLERHSSLVAQLDEIYTNQTIGEMVFDNADDLRLARNLINNVLASSALYTPSRKAWRQAIRTWTRYGDGEDGMPHDERWHMFVGVPGDTVRLPGMRRHMGRMHEGKPESWHHVRGAPGGGPIIMNQAKEAADVPEQGILHYDQEIRSKADLMKFLGWANEKVKIDLVTGLKVELVDAVKAQPTFDQMFPGWHAVVMGDTTILLERNG